MYVFFFLKKKKKKKKLKKFGVLCTFLIKLKKFIFLNF